MVGSLWQQYLQPTSLVEALQALWSTPCPAYLVAGGTDLLLDLRQGRRNPAHTLVDVSSIPDLKALEVRGAQEVRGAELFIGAAVPVSQVITSPLVNGDEVHRPHARALAEACDLIGGPQVRNVATLGGNVAHALPAADGAIALLALDAVAVVAALASPTNPSEVGAKTPTTNDEVVLRRKPVLDLYVGPGRTALEPEQILVGFYLPLAAAGQGTAFKRVMRDQGVALPVLNVAVWLARQDETVVDVRIALGPAGPVPQRALAAEAALCGQPFIPETISKALQVMLAEVRFRTSPQRATAEYRQRLAGRLLADALYVAWKRAKS